MANMIEAAGPAYPPPENLANLGDLDSLLPEMNEGPGHSWDRDWQDLWQNSGLDQGWIFNNLE